MPKKHHSPKIRTVSLRPEDHKYVYEPTGQQMKTSVTSVINYFKDPNRFGRDTTQRDIGIHVHDWLHHWATFGSECEREDAFRYAPEGHDCGEWIARLKEDEFLAESYVLASEFTMCNTQLSLGGQLDLLIALDDKVILVDLKTKSNKYKSPSKADIAEYKAQAGGYLELFYFGNQAERHLGKPIVTECRTLIVTPAEAKWLSPYNPYHCKEEWDKCWGKYAAAALTTF